MRKESGQFLTVFRIGPIVGVQPENPLARGRLHAGISGRRETIDPRKEAHVRSKPPGNFHGAVRRAGIANVDLLKETGSTDRTVEIARRFGANVSFFPWIDSF